MLDRIQRLSLDGARRLDAESRGCAVGMKDPPMIISDGGLHSGEWGDRGPTKRSLLVAGGGEPSLTLSNVQCRWLLRLRSYSLLREGREGRQKSGAVGIARTDRPCRRREGREGWHKNGRRLWLSMREAAALLCHTCGTHEAAMHRVSPSAGKDLSCRLQAGIEKFLEHFSPGLVGTCPLCLRHPTPSLSAVVNSHGEKTTDGSAEEVAWALGMWIPS